MTARRLLYLAIAIATCLGASCLAFATMGDTRYAGKEFRSPVWPHETQLWHSPWQNQLQLSSVSQTSLRRRCEADRPPEALATPDPMVDTGDGGLRITVSFVVGTDGRVHSPFILDSAGPSEDQSVLRAVQRWRYRPAMCNGVPTEVEAKIEFLTREQR